MTQAFVSRYVATNIIGLFVLIACFTLNSTLHALDNANDRILEVISHNGYNTSNADKTYRYASRPERDLNLHVWKPRTVTSGTAPVIVMYHGGGWNTGSPSAFARSALYFALSGYYVVTPEYRLRDTDGTTPIDAAHDSEAALQWVIDNQGIDGMNWDNQRIALMGSSAGSHLAMVTGLGGRVEGLENGDANILAYTLFNSVYDVSPEGYGNGRLGTKPEEYEPYSPHHLIHEDMAPIFFTHGEKDTSVPHTQALAFDQKLEDLGVEKLFRSYAHFGHSTGSSYSTDPLYQKRWMYGIYNVENFLEKQLAAIPEPSSLALLSLSMIALIRRK
ncbi:alpha/beta hydrolase fold protein [Poriferisphaera corsica]|uniref:Alpha/beta hydrolase fold protein n=1 Tax=Poriferisphaera corsica TaxID=2528020 RepID=A0A517YY77_9BACT|nr:alpha/beta hydrolase [Poriferisphaera corsica]QDU35165.1 alpha/beta hydrolase fold protein [Poriferisphaera corsica]